MEFISAAFGHGRSDAKIVAAHAKLKGLQMQHFDAVASHLSDSLSELEVPQVSSFPVGHTYLCLILGLSKHKHLSRKSFGLAEHFDRASRSSARGRHNTVV